MRLPWWRMGECSPGMAGTGEIKTLGGPKLALPPWSLTVAHQGLEEENLDQK